MFASPSLVIMLVCTSTTACLTDCYCGQLGGYLSVLICNNREWTEIPSNLSTSLEAIDFSNNQIDLLEADDFQGMQNMKSVELQCNNIIELPVDIFSNAKLLEMIDLSFNNIETLPVEVFKYNSRLEKLYLKQNPLSTLSGSRPILSSHSLRILDISYCDITELWDVSLSNLKNLASLNLVGNNFTSLHVGVIKPLQGLRQIEIPGDELECKDISVHETIEYLRKRSVDVIPPEVCMDNDLDENSAEIVTSSAPKLFHAEVIANEPHVPSWNDARTTENNFVIMRSGVGIPRDAKSLQGIHLTDIAQAFCLLLAASFLMAVTIMLFRLKRRRSKQKQRPPMPLPDRFGQDQCTSSDSNPAPPRDRVYTSTTGSLHEYAYPEMGQEDHYSVVQDGAGQRPSGAPQDDDYLAPSRPPTGSPPPAVHVSQSSMLRPPQKPWAELRRPGYVTWEMVGSMEPLLGQRCSRPVYRETTAPVPDVIGHVGLLEVGRKYMTSSYMLVPPRPSLSA